MRNITGLVLVVLLVAGCGPLGREESVPEATATPSQEAAAASATPELLQELVLYVASDGNDAWSGRLAQPNAAWSDGPLATLEQARDTIRRIKAAQGLPPGGVKVYLRGGSYQRSVPFLLGAEDAGSATVPIVYAAYPGEEVRISGAIPLDGRQFNRDLPEQIRRRLSSAAQLQVWQIDLRSQGVQRSAPILPRAWNRPGNPAWQELIVDDQPLQLARWPNNVGVTGTAQDRALWSFIGALPDGEQGLRFNYQSADNRPAKWAASENIWLHGFLVRDWADVHARIAAIDSINGTITLDRTGADDPDGRWRGLRSGMRYYVYNVLEELDAPGEYFIDPQSLMLYVWPPHNLRTARVALTQLDEPLFVLQNTSFIHIERLIFEGGRSDAIRANDVHAVRIAGCTIRNFGANGVVISNGSDTLVTSSDIYNLDTGISVDGGDRAALIAAGNRVQNNHIHTYGRLIKTYSPAIKVRGVGVHVANNYIHSAPHTAIMFAGNNHVIERNEIHNVAQETEDVGVISAGRSWSQGGTIVRHNYIHNNAFGDAIGIGTNVIGVYLDDGFAGAQVIGNIFNNTGTGVYSKGPLNRIENNVFLNNSAARASAERLGALWVGNTPREHLELLISDLEQFDYQNPPWSTQYPQLLEFMQRYGRQRNNLAAVPFGLVAQRNIFFNNAHDLSIWPPYLAEPYTSEFQLRVRDNLFVTADPGFVDAATGRLLHHPDYQAQGFARIPVEQIGLYPDAYRQDGPAQPPES